MARSSDRVQRRRRDGGGEHDAGLVVAVVGDLPRRLDCAPRDQAERRVVRIEPAHRLHLGP
jgi:hypothetical protein